MQYQLSRIIAGPFLRGLWHPQVVGGENIPDTGGAILASNHLSVIDSVFLPLMLTRPVTFAAKSEYFTSRRPGAAAHGPVHQGHRPAGGGPGGRTGRPGDA